MVNIYSFLHILTLVDIFPHLQMEKLIMNERQKACGGMDKFEKLATLYERWGKNDSILQFNVSFPDEKKQQKIMGWGKPSLFHLLKYKDLRVHVDATFKPTPNEFYQTLIFGVLDPGTQMHVPVFFVLMTGKTEICYDVAFFHMEMAVGESILTMVNFYRF